VANAVFLQKPLARFVFLVEPISLYQNAGKEIEGMKVELQKPGEEVDGSKQERVAKRTDTAETDEVVAHGVQVNFTCPNCGAILTGEINDAQLRRCPKCGFLFNPPFV
jgi:predicted RNA-binding Zn-ribbon protein involved in translation (DUF1610 family)